MTVLNDSRGIANGETIPAPVCIIGGGAAGLVIANDLTGSGVPCIVLEAGETRPTRKSRSAYWVRRTGSVNPPHRRIALANEAGLRCFMNSNASRDYVEEEALGEVSGQALR